MGFRIGNELADRIRFLEERTAVLESKVRVLEACNQYATDDPYNSLWQGARFVSLNTVVKRIAQHLGMKIYYRPPMPESVDVSFKDGGTTNE